MAGVCSGVAVVWLGCGSGAAGVWLGCGSGVSIHLPIFLSIFLSIYLGSTPHPLTVDKESIQLAVSDRILIQLRVVGPGKGHCPFSGSFVNKVALRVPSLSVGD